MRITISIELQDSTIAIVDEVNREEENEALGTAIAVALTGVQTPRKLLSIAHAIIYLSGGGDDREIHESELGLMDAAKELIDYWEKSDEELRKQTPKL